MEQFLLVFIPIFIAIDAFGILPMYLSITEKFPPQQKKRLALEGICTAFIVCFAFAAVGHYIFSFVGITAQDFQIAGGLLLLVFSIRELFGQSNKEVKGRSPDKLIGIVPLGVPLIAGPAMITTMLILHNQYSLGLITLGLISNMIITLILFVNSDQIVKVIGQGVSRVFAKIAAIFLAAIGIMMIRRGLEVILRL